MDEFTGKVAVITGGASGIGRAMAERFAADGMKIVLCDVEPDALGDAVNAMVSNGHEVHGVVADVSDPDAMQRVADEAASTFGGWHLVCLNAGVGSGGPIWEQTLADWEWVLGVNLWGVVHGVRTFVPGLVAKGEGHVVITASLAGHICQPFTGPYNVSKFGAVAIGETLHAELAQTAPGVGVSILCPAWVSTRIYESSRNRPEHLTNPGGTDDAVLAEMQRAFANAMPPAEVADAVASAVRERRLHIFTHDFSAEAIRSRTDQILGT